MVEWEDELFYEVFYFGDKNDAAARSYAEEAVAVMRGEDKTVKELVPADLKAINFSKEILEDKNFQKKVLRTLYRSLNLDLAPPLLELQDKLEDQLFGDKSTIVLGVEDSIFYRTIYVIIAMNYFHLIPNRSRWFIFGGGFLALAILLGFKVEEVVKLSVDESVNFYSRRDLCLDLAAFMAQNETELSYSEEGVSRQKGVAVKDLINQFRNYCKNDFSGSNLLNFLNEPNVVQYFGPGDKEIAQAILELYVHLINGFFIVPDGDFEALNKKIKEMEEPEKASAPTSKPVAASTPPARGSDYSQVKKYIERKYIKGPDGQFENIEGVFGELAGFAAQRGDQKIAELFYFDEKEGKFKWTI